MITSCYSRYKFMAILKQVDTNIKMDDHLFMRMSTFSRILTSSFLMTLISSRGIFSI